MDVLAVARPEDAVPWLVVAGIALAAWAVLFAAVATATMPRLPDPGPETMDLGPESPAVTNFLVNRCHLTTSALSATLVDLAARDHVALESIGGGQELVRLRAQPRDALTGYEEQVLALVRGRASHDTVPAAELSLGYGDKAERWWTKWRDEVVQHARDLGFVRRRFNPAHIALLAGTLAVPFLFGGIAFEVYSAATRAADHKKSSVGGGMAVAAMVWIGALVLGGRILRGWRDTPTGTRATARWLGVRNFLHRDEAFRETPPGGVVIWDRLLAYGVALGVAHGADAALPIGPTRNDEGWSPYRGLWRQVRITYPKRFRYGDSPRRAAVVSVLVLAAATAAGIFVARAFVPGVADAADRLTNGTNAADRWILAAAAVILSVPVVYVVIQIVRGVVTLRRAVADFGRRETFEGSVVRVPWHYVSDNDGNGRWEPMGYTAVDDGRGDELRALRYYRADVREGQTVQVTMTPHMRHVIAMTVEPRPEATTDGETRHVTP